MSGDPTRQPRRVVRRERVQDQVDEQRRDDHAARRAPHVARRHVAPPAVVEAEEDEDGELDPDDDRERLPREQVLVERRNALVEADPERQPPRGRDQDRVGEEIEDAVSRDRQRHAATPTALRTTSTTRSCCSDVMPGPQRHGEVLAREPLGLRQRALRVAEVAQRRLQVQRRQVVRRAADLRVTQRADDTVALGRAADEEVIDVTRLVLGRRRRARRGRARGSARQPRAARSSTRRGEAGKGAARRRGSRRGASCSPRARIRPSPSSRGSGAGARARRAPRRSRRRGRASPSAKRFFVG